MSTIYIVDGTGMYHFNDHNLRFFQCNCLEVSRESLVFRNDHRSADDIRHIPEKFIFNGCAQITINILSHRFCICFRSVRLDQKYCRKTVSVFQNESERQTTST